MIKKILSFTLIFTVAISLTCVPFSAAEISADREEEVWDFFLEYTNELKDNAVEDESIPFPYLLVEEKYRDREEYEAMAKQYLTGNMLNGFLNNLYIRDFDGQVGIYNTSILDNPFGPDSQIRQEPTFTKNDLHPIKEFRYGDVVYRILAGTAFDVKNPFQAYEYVMSDKWEYIYDVKNWCLSSSLVKFPRYADRNLIFSWGCGIEEGLYYLDESTLTIEPPYETDPFKGVLTGVCNAIIQALHIHNLYIDTSLFFDEASTFRTRENNEIIEIDGTLYEIAHLEWYDNLDSLRSVLYPLYTMDVTNKYLTSGTYIEYEGHFAVKIAEPQGQIYDFSDENLTLDIVYNENDTVKVELGLPQYDENKNLMSTKTYLVTLKKETDLYDYKIVDSELLKITEHFIPDTADSNTEAYVLLSIAAVAMGMWITIRCLRKKA